MGRSNKMEDKHQNEEETTTKAARLKTLAEQKYSESDLKSALKYAKRSLRLCPQTNGTAELVTAFKILRAAAKSTGTPDYYRILDVEHFSHINTVKKHYKKLALTLHPDKNPHSASEEAFKLVGEAIRVLSDKIRRKEYDMKLRIALQAAALVNLVVGDTFWTACSACRLMHQFERRYLAHNLVCPNCHKTFQALELSGEEVDHNNNYNSSSGAGGDVGGVGVKSSRRLEAKRKMASVGDILKRAEPISVDNVDQNLSSAGGGGRVASERLRAKKRANGGEEMMTLAEMQRLAKRRLKEKEKYEGKERRGKCGESEGGILETEKRLSLLSFKDGKKLNEKSKSGGAEVMDVVDSDFYDFDRDRVERSFRKGQLWAVYDDDDGMPRHYGLIDDVVSVNPFEVKMSWLDHQNDADEALVCWEKLGVYVSCGRFKVSRKTSVNSLNIFSHTVDGDRVARQLYRIYPKKGSVWALYDETSLGNDRDRRCYDIVIFLTSYSETHGLSMAYLEKVNGFKTVFKRREIGGNAIKWLEKNDIRLFSHQIPARKLSRKETSDLAKDCWELDPASLPSELLITGCPDEG